MLVQGFESAWIYTLEAQCQPPVLASIGAVKKDGAQATHTYYLVMVHVLMIYWFVSRSGEEIDKYIVLKKVKK